MFIFAWIILTIVDKSAEVPEWILNTSGILALLEAAWYAFLLILGFGSWLVEYIKEKRNK